MDTVTARTGHVKELVDRHLERLLERQLGRLAFLGEEEAGLIREHLVAFVLGGGKRLRPEFVYWGYLAGGGERPEDVLPAACAVELVHAAALLLDDMMDEAGTRRGRPAAHVALAGLHRARGRRGDPDRFGESAATLLALLALTWADAALLESGPNLPAALDHLTRLRVEAIGGQYLDLTRTSGARLTDTPASGTGAGREARGEGSSGSGEEEQARLISLYKSGKYTVERPLLLGHAVAGGCAPTRRLLSAYALPLGEAFQLRDDVNGVFGDPAETGKPAGADLLQGKATYLLAEARRRTGGADALDDIKDADGVAAARRLIVECGALDAAERRITGLAAEAVAALAHPPGLPPEARKALTKLAATATATATATVTAPEPAAAATATEPATELATEPAAATATEPAAESADSATRAEGRGR